MLIFHELAVFIRKIEALHIVFKLSSAMNEMLDGITGGKATNMHDQSKLGSVVLWSYFHLMYLYSSVTVDDIPYVHSCCDYFLFVRSVDSLVLVDCLQVDDTHSRVCAIYSSHM